MLITSYPYENACNTYIIKFYNSTPALIGQTLLSNYTGTDLCNSTFNFTTRDTYTINISSGESARLIVEGDDDMNTAIAISLTLFSIVFIGLGFYLLFKKPENDKETST